MADLIAEALTVLRAAKVSAGDALALLDSVAAGDGADARQRLAAIRQRIVTAQDLHLQLAQTLLRIERQQKLAREALHFEHPVYWRLADDGKKHGPYCPTCWDDTRRIAALHVLPFRGHDRWVCRICSRTFFSDGARQAMAEAENTARRHQPDAPDDPLAND